MYIKAANVIFWNVGARKARYIRYLSQFMINPKMPPNPVGTRWNCWFDAVQYHREHLQHFHDFIKEEVSHGGRLSPDSLTSLKETLSCPTEPSMLEAEMSFILKHCELFVKATDIFQVKNQLLSRHGLDTIFTCGVSLAQAEKHFPDAGLEQIQKLELQDNLCLAFYLVNQKFFDPKNLIILDDCDLTALLCSRNTNQEIQRISWSNGCKGIWGYLNQPDSFLKQCQF